MKTFIGRGEIKQLSLILKENSYKNAIVFTGRTSFAALKDILLPELQGCLFNLYSEFSPNPKYEDIIKSVTELENNAYDVVIAIGGGSAIDFAKAYKYYSKSPLPLIAVPTTAGTGSEATQIAVIYIDGKKHSLDEPYLLPDYAIVDSQFIENSPSYLKACCGMDAFCQALESYWAVKATSESQELARKSIELCKNFLVSTVITNDPEPAEQMALASNLAGRAINISRTTASHALSYAITTRYGIPHGHAVALTIAALFLANLNITDEDCVDPRGAAYVKRTMLDLMNILDFQTENDIRPYFRNLMKQIGLEWRLDNLGIKDINYIVSSVNLRRLGNNPKNLTNKLSSLFSL